MKLCFSFSLTNNNHTSLFGGAIMDRLTKSVNNSDWITAENIINEIYDKHKDNANFFILAAEVYSHLDKKNYMFECISNGIKLEPTNYELYYMLGNYYSDINSQQAYLCYEMAAFYAANTDDETFLNNIFSDFKNTNLISVNPTSVVIVSYNSCEVTQGCIQTLRESTPHDSYELIVVDNASTDGITEWLDTQKDITLIKNTDNKGFAYACNQGVNASCAGNDLLFLHNDTLITPNSVFWLKMGLYNSDDTGATGAISNYAQRIQQVSETFSSITEWFDYATKINRPGLNAYEPTICLDSFALLVRRNVYDAINGFDDKYGIGYLEDADLCVRILNLGYKLFLCRNSFIYHFGALSFKNNTSEFNTDLVYTNRQYFKDKWNFDLTYYTHARTELINLISTPKDEEIRVLEIGCGAGSTLAKISYLWPESQVAGVEIDSNIATLGAKYLNIIQGNIETMELPYEHDYFDYIILGDVLEHLFDPDAAIQKLLPYLNANGCIISSIPNVQHVSVLLPLLYGQFDYKDAGILDRTHVKFFTLKSVNELALRNSLRIEEMRATRGEEHVITQVSDLYNELVKLLGKEFEQQTKAYQYIFRARKADN